MMARPLALVLLAAIVLSLNAYIFYQVKLHRAYFVCLTVCQFGQHSGESHSPKAEAVLVDLQAKVDATHALIDKVGH